jgi:hypothetical protein
MPEPVRWVCSATPKEAAVRVLVTGGTGLVGSHTVAGWSSVAMRCALSGSRDMVGGFAASVKRRLPARARSPYPPGLAVHLAVRSCDGPMASNQFERLTNPICGDGPTRIALRASDHDRMLEAADRSEQGPVIGLQPGTWDVATQDRELVAEDQDLQVLGGITAGEQHEQLDGAAQREVGEFRQHQSDLAVGA